MPIQLADVAAEMRNLRGAVESFITYNRSVIERLNGVSNADELQAVIDEMKATEAEISAALITGTPLDPNPQTAPLSGGMTPKIPADNTKPAGPFNPGGVTSGGDGTMSSTRSDGSTVVTNPDGSTTTTELNGNVVVRSPSGQVLSTTVGQGSGGVTSGGFTSSDGSSSGPGDLSSSGGSPLSGNGPIV